MDENEKRFLKKKLIHNLSLWKTSVRGKPAGLGLARQPWPSAGRCAPGAVDKYRWSPVHNAV
jgi:hypothetical protein